MDVYGKEYPLRPNSRPVDCPIAFGNNAGLSRAMQRRIVATYTERCESRRKAKICRERRRLLEYGTHVAPDGSPVTSVASLQRFCNTACVGRS